MITFWLLIIAMTLLALSILVLPSLRKKQAIMTNILLVLIFPILAISFYFKLGAYSSVTDQQKIVQQKKSIDLEIKKLGSLQNITLTLKQKVEANPDSHGFLLLGRLYLKTQQFKEASEAFSKANQLTSNEPEILIGYAESLYFSHQKKLTAQAKQLLAQTLKLQPNQPDALNLLAIAAYQQGDYNVAIQYWEKLLAQIQPGSAEQEKLLQTIAATQEKIKSTQHPTPTSVQLVVHVKLAESLKKQVSAKDTLFIYAQAIKGPAIPLAIVRKQARDLPITVTLDQTMAMLSTNTLANHKQVRVIARISKSGQASAKTGDLQGNSSVIETAHPPAKIAIIIDKLVAN